MPKWPLTAELNLTGGANASNRGRWDMIGTTATRRCLTCSSPSGQYCAFLQAFCHENQSEKNTSQDDEGILTQMFPPTILLSGSSSLINHYECHILTILTRYHKWSKRTFTSSEVLQSFVLHGNLTEYKTVIHKYAS